MADELYGVAFAFRIVQPSLVGVGGESYAAFVGTNPAVWYEVVGIELRDGGAVKYHACSLRHESGGVGADALATGMKERGQSPTKANLK